MKRVLLTFLAVMALAAQADEIADSRALVKAALEARAAGNAPLFLEKISAAAALRPQHPTILYYAAIANAMAGRGDEALAAIDRIARMGFVYEPEKEPALAALRNDPRFTAAAGRFAANARPLGRPAVAFTVDRPGMIPEGLAYDPVSGRFFVSSVRTRAIFAVDRSGRVRPFFRSPRLGVFGMTVDVKRHVLWAAASALEQVEGFEPRDRGQAALLAIDLASGRLRQSLAPPDGGEHLFGDVALAPDGTPYVSDTTANTIYRVRNGRLEPFASGPFVSLQGLTFRGGRTLVAADYSKGLFAIDLATRDIAPIAVPPECSLLGIDGIYAAGDSIIGVQNGTDPNRIVRIELEPGRLRVGRVVTFAANNRGMADPTLGVVIGKAFFFNANVQWNAFREDGTLRPEIPLQPLHVMKVELNRER